MDVKNYIMKCTNCGKEIDDDSNYCEYCGTKQNITENTPSGFVDLGLPSGTLWAEENEIGYYNYDTAVQKFGDKLPTKEQWEELNNMCQWTWTGNGYKVVGPSGTDIVLPAAGYNYCCGGESYVGSRGYYWANTPYNQVDAWRLSFNSSEAYMDYVDRSSERSVRLIHN